MNATVDIAPPSGGAKKGKVTDYQEIRGYILAEKPTMLRMIGLFPVVRNRAFDMVSDGTDFKLWIPPKNKFIVGRNDVIKPNSGPATRKHSSPAHLRRLAAPEIDLKNEIAVLEGDTEQVTDPKTQKLVGQPNYVVNVIRHDPDGRWSLSRKIYFDACNSDLTFRSSMTSRVMLPPSPIIRISRLSAASASPDTSRSAARRRSTTSA